MFPITHWRQIWSTNALEPVNREIKCRTAAGTYMFDVFVEDKVPLNVVGDDLGRMSGSLEALLTQVGGQRDAARVRLSLSQADRLRLLGTRGNRGGDVPGRP